MKSDFWYLALGVRVVIVILLATLIITAVKRIRQGATYGWGMLWWCAAGLAMFILYRPFYVKFRPSFVHWPALLGVTVVTAIWIACGVQLAVLEMRDDRERKRAKLEQDQADAGSRG